MAIKKKSTIAPSALAKLRDIKLDIQPIEFKDADEFKAAYETADEAVKQAAEVSVDRQAEVIAALAKMRSILSQRGSKEMREQAGITRGWTQYFAWFKRTYHLRMCLRTVINKIDQLGGKKLCLSCKKVDGHTPSCKRYKKPAPQLSPKECRLLAGLSAAHDLVKAVEHGGNVAEAVREYKKFAPTPERLDEWIDQQVIPYQPTSGDVLVVDGQQVTVLEVRGISTEDDAHILTIAVEPVTRPAPVAVAKTPKSAFSPASTESTKASEAAAA